MINAGAVLTLDGVLDRPQENSRQAAQRTVSALFEEVRDPLSSYLLHRGVPRDLVEEAVQAAFLKLYEHVLANGPSTNLRGWVFRVARNAALNDLRRGKRFVPADAHTERQEEAGPGPPLQDLIASATYADQRQRPDELALDRERNQRLRVALSRLTPVQRECLHLRATGMKYREIGEVTGMPISTVADCLSQALEQLEEECNG